MMHPGVLFGFGTTRQGTRVSEGQLQLQLAVNIIEALPSVRMQSVSVVLS